MLLDDRHSSLDVENLTHYTHQVFVNQFSRSLSVLLNGFHRMWPRSRGAATSRSWTHNVLSRSEMCPSPLNCATYYTGCGKKK